MLVILDMDFTLVDTTNVERIRRSGRYNITREELSDTVVYDGINEMVNALDSEGHDLVVLTNSPSRDARILNEIHEKGNGDIFYYKDLGVPAKPNSRGHRKLLERTGTVSAQAVSIGDNSKDRIAAQGAGFRFIAATWGADSVSSLTVESDAIAERPEDVIRIIRKWET